jgi:hypothetical protein
MHEEYVFFEPNMDTLNSFMLFTKYTTNQNPKEKGYAFKNFILTVWEMTEPGRKKKKKKKKKKKEEEEDRKMMNHYPQHQPH